MNNIKNLKKLSNSNLNKSYNKSITQFNGRKISMDAKSKDIHKLSNLKVPNHVKTVDTLNFSQLNQTNHLTRNTTTIKTKVTPEFTTQKRNFSNLDDAGSILHRASKLQSVLKVFGPPKSKRDFEAKSNVSIVQEEMEKIKSKSIVKEMFKFKVAKREGIEKLLEIKKMSKLVTDPAGFISKSIVKQSILKAIVTYAPETYEKGAVIYLDNIDVLIKAVQEWQKQNIGASTVTKESAEFLENRLTKIHELGGKNAFNIVFKFAIWPYILMAVAGAYEALQNDENTSEEESIFRAFDNSILNYVDEVMSSSIDKVVELLPAIPTLIESVSDESASKKLQVAKKFNNWVEENAGNKEQKTPFKGMPTTKTFYSLKIDDSSSENTENGKGVSNKKTGIALDIIKKTPLIQPGTPFSQNTIEKSAEKTYTLTMPIKQNVQGWVVENQPNQEPEENHHFAPTFHFPMMDFLKPVSPDMVAALPKDQEEDDDFEGIIDPENEAEAVEE